MRLCKVDRVDLPRLTPTFPVDGQRLTMLTPLARSISKRDILGTVARLDEYDHEIRAALDMLVSGL